MRRVIWMMSVSLDGFIEGPDRDLGLHLVDELRLYVHPVVLGKPMFLRSGSRLDLRLVESRSIGNGVVLLRHRRPDE